MKKFQRKLGLGNCINIGTNSYPNSNFKTKFWIFLKEYSKLAPALKKRCKSSYIITDLLAHYLIF